MSSGLHKLAGGVFQHVKPGLCERCAFRQPYGEWEGYCTARGKVLSYKPAGAGKPRCPDFSDAEDEVDVDALKELAADVEGERFLRTEGWVACE